MARQGAAARRSAGGQGREFGVDPKGLADRWRDRPITEIDGDQVHAIIDEVRERGVPGLEKRVDGPSESRALAMFATLSKLLSWLVERRRISQNPCIAVHRPPTLPARDRVLTNPELVKFWRAADAERREFGALLKLLLLTGARLNEVARMRRPELSEDGAIWTMPGQRTKNKRVHVVPLPAAAQTIIADVPITGDVVFTDEWQDARHLRVEDQEPARHKDEDSAVAAPRPAPHGRDRHGRNRHRAPHHRGGAEPRLGREGRRGGNLQQGPVRGREEGRAGKMGRPRRGFSRGQTVECRGDEGGA